MWKTQIYDNVFSLDKKEAARKGLEPEEELKKKDQKAAEERRLKMKMNKTQTGEATLEKEEEA